MGFLNKGKLRRRCTTENNELKCRINQVNPDGTEVSLAEVHAVVNADCIPSITSSEGEPGAQEALEDYVGKRLNIKCSKNRGTQQTQEYPE